MSNICPRCAGELEFISGSSYMGDYQGPKCTKCDYDDIKFYIPHWIKVEGLSPQEFYEQEVLGVGVRDEYGSL